MSAVQVIKPEPGWGLRVEPCESGTPGRRAAIVMTVHAQESVEVGMYLSDAQIDGLITDLQAAKRGLIQNVYTGDANRKDA